MNTPKPVAPEQMKMTPKLAAPSFKPMPIKNDNKNRPLADHPGLKAMLDADNKQVSLKTELIKPVFFGGGLVVGAGVAYLLTKKHYEKKADEEIQSVKELYKDMFVEGVSDEADTTLSDINAEFLEYEEQVSTLSYGNTPDEPHVMSSTAYNKAFMPDDFTRPGYEPEVEATEVVEGISDDPEDPSTWERGKDFPYVITHEEFVGDDEYEKITLTYFMRDQVLMNEAEEVADDTDDLVGDDNLRHFGVGSQDPNIVYIRNLSVSTDFEVILDQRSYTKVILGLDEQDETILSKT